MKILLIINLFLLSINISCKKKESEKLNFWEDFKHAVEVNNIEYLLDVSNDTLQCLSCNNGNDLIYRNDFFENHIDNIKIILDKDYLYDIEKIEDSGISKKIYRINYRFEKYNLIYTFIEFKSKKTYHGVFSVP